MDFWEIVHNFINRRNLSAFALIRRLFLDCAWNADEDCLELLLRALIPCLRTLSFTENTISAFTLPILEDLYNAKLKTFGTIVVSHRTMATFRTSFKATATIQRPY